MANDCDFNRFHVELLALLMALAGFLPAFRPAMAAPIQEKVYFDFVDDEGNLTGGYVMQDQPVFSKSTAPLAAQYVTVLDNGPPSNRIDFVLVGDGYTATDLALYAQNVDAVIAGYFAVEPFATYQTLFNVHRVDVVSNEAGVDNDPVTGILRDTAMDMAFFCGGTERLLCIDVAKAYQFAANAPEVDHVLALANATKYGGAGYTSSDLATLSGGNPSAIELALHETGHSLGNLADEYDYSGGATYQGQEPGASNVSTYDHAAMEAWGGKWAPWLGDTIGGLGGYISTYEGAAYYTYGIYRSTLDSRMKTLGRPFNAVSIEGIIIELYNLVSPVDAHTPTGVVLDETMTAFVSPLKPVGHNLDVQWFLDGNPIASATGDSLTVADLAPAPGTHTLSVTVVDNTPYVRDEGFRAANMTVNLSWDIDIGVISGVEDSPQAARAVLYDAYPNPFNPATTIVFELTGPSGVGLEIFDVSGRRVRTLLNGGFHDPGRHEAIWNGRDDRGRLAAAGAYFYRFEAGEYSETRRLMLVN